MLTGLQVLGRAATITALVLFAWVFGGATGALLVSAGAAVGLTVELVAKRKA
jgi:hypothetical protein